MIALPWREGKRLVTVPNSRVNRRRTAAMATSKDSDERYLNEPHAARMYSGAGQIADCNYSISSNGTN
jgi:hypothetical protein